MKKIKEDLAGVASGLTTSANALAEMRATSERAWEAHKLLIKDGYEKGLSLDQIASLTGVTKSRIWQVVNGKKK